MKLNIPELTFVYATEYSQAYVIKENGFRPMILLVDVLNKEFFINYRKYSYKEQSEITKAVYDFQNEDIEEGYKEDALIFRKLLKSNYKSIVEKMINILDEKEELFCEKVKYEGKADKTLEEKLGSEEYNKFIEHCEELCDKPLLPADIFDFKGNNPSFDNLKQKVVTFTETYVNSKGDTLQFDFIAEPMLEDKYYQRTEYKPKKEVQDELGNCFHQSNTDNTNLLKEDLEKQVSDCFKETYRYTVKQITPDIQHIITPSKNYFLFKLINK